MRPNDLSQFTFHKVGAGHYMVTYTTERRGTYVRALITDMTLIDATLHAEWATLADIKRLRKVVRATGIHYRANGKRVK